MNKNILIFEGPDRCGKTTIANYLAEKLRISYFKDHSQTNNFKNNSFVNSAFIQAFFLIDMLKQVEFKENGIIIDRHIASEWAYSKTFNRKTNEELIFEVDKQMAELGAKIVYCFKTEYKNFDDDIVKLNNIEELKNNYMEFFSKTSMPVLTLDTTNEDLSQQIREIILWI